MALAPKPLGDKWSQFCRKQINHHKKLDGKRESLKTGPQNTTWFTYAIFEVRPSRTHSAAIEHITFQPPPLNGTLPPSYLPAQHSQMVYKRTVVQVWVPSTSRGQFHENGTTGRHGWERNADYSVPCTHVGSDGLRDHSVHDIQCTGECDALTLPLAMPRAQTSRANWSGSAKPRGASICGAARDRVTWAELASGLCERFAAVEACANCYAQFYGETQKEGEFVEQFVTKKVQLFRQLNTNALLTGASPDITAVTETIPHCVVTGESVEGRRTSPTWDNTPCSVEAGVSGGTAGPLQRPRKPPIPDHCSNRAEGGQKPPTPVKEQKPVGKSAVRGDLHDAGLPAPIDHVPKQICDYLVMTLTAADAVAALVDTAPSHTFIQPTLIQTGKIAPNPDHLQLATQDNTDSMLWTATLRMNKPDPDHRNGVPAQGHHAGATLAGRTRSHHNGRRPSRFEEQRVIQEQVYKKWRERVIELSKSRYNSQIVLVPKKDGGIRFSVDFQPLNLVTESAPPSQISTEDTLASVQDVCMLSTLDLAYTRLWTFAFTTLNGCRFYFPTMPFSLKCAPSTFQNMKARVLQGIIDEFVTDYLDDTISWLRSWEEHVRHLDLVLERLAIHQLVVSTRKCHIKKPKLNFVRHIVSGTTTRKILLEFNGKANWLCNYILRFTRLAASMTNLLSTKFNFCWTTQAQQAFDELKAQFTRCHILICIDPQKHRRKPNRSQGSAVQAGCTGTAPGEPVCKCEIWRMPHMAGNELSYLLSQEPDTAETVMDDTDHDLLWPLERLLGTEAGEISETPKAVLMMYVKTAHTEPNNWTDVNNHILRAQQTSSTLHDLSTPCAQGVRERGMENMYPQRNANMSTTTRMIIGFPSIQGQFTRRVWRQWWERMNMKPLMTPVYHLAANPTERQNQDLKVQLKLGVGEYHTQWNTHRHDTLFCLRQRVNAVGNPCRPDKEQWQGQKGKHIEVARQRQYQYVGAIMPTMTVPPSQLRPWEAVCVKNYPLSAGTCNFCAGLTPRWIGPCKVKACTKNGTELPRQSEPSQVAVRIWGHITTAVSLPDPEYSGGRVHLSYRSRRRKWKPHGKHKRSSQRKSQRDDPKDSDGRLIGSSMEQIPEVNQSPALATLAAPRYQLRTRPRGKRWECCPGTDDDNGRGGKRH
ncbi:hypothetical protein PR048_011017 [Dryococelus australis]|uniref:Reverse transcriptase domain-containing protein n=1 Tax=Dryococelus australis TaxID=614101 RepID=A0ABQ9HKE0_9NEOP|nr:hypothetical protein PR048_011017 [Dryococelus australis]